VKRARSCHAKAVQSAAVAAGVLAGQSTSQIAAELGVTARRVRQLIADDDTRQIIAAVVNERLDVIVELFDRSLDVIERAMRAKQRTKDGTIIGPDHYARLAAVSQLIKILTAGRPIPKAPEPKREEEGIVDYEQLCKIVEAKLQKLEGPK
jgi:predicted transcriptional regulator